MYKKRNRRGDTFASVNSFGAADTQNNIDNSLLVLVKGKCRKWKMMLNRAAKITQGLKEMPYSMT